MAEEPESEGFCKGFSAPFFSNQMHFLRKNAFVGGCRVF